MGTENLLARYARHSASPRRVLELVESGSVIHLDAGRVAGQLFALVVSAGFDAQVIHQVHRERRGHITHLAYARPLALALAQYNWPQIRATATGPDGAQTVTEGSWAFAANLPSYAQGLPIVHSAKGCDGWLDLCVFRKGSVMSGFWYFWHVLRRRHYHLPSVTTARFTHLRLESVDGSPIPIQVDGDPGGMLPVEIDVVPRRLPLVVLPHVANKLGFQVDCQQPRSA
jgi:diacylglycerol kinase family enzyme